MWLRRSLIGLLVCTVVAVAASVLSKLTHAPGTTPHDVLVGLVRDAKGPLPGVRVRRKGDPAWVESDAGGRFSLPHSQGRVTAWKDGYLIAGLDPDASPFDLLLTKLPAEDCPRYTWVDPTPDQSRAGACANCHPEIYKEWSASGHARSANGKHFRNLYNGTDWNGRVGVSWSLHADKPEGGGVCAACHTPTAEVGAKLPEIEGVAAQGVHCDYCHKISGIGDGTIGRTHGRFNLDLLRPTEGQLFFGPLDDVDRGEDAYSPLYKDSKYCASCHEGVVFGVHVYSTYSEWLDSPARKEGKQCQTCHMKPTGVMTNIAPGKGGIERDPMTLANHRFFAGSQEEMLKQCVKLSAKLAREGKKLRAEIAVSAEGVGHRVPTGFIDRHLLLVVDALDEEGQSLPALDGPKLPPAAGKQLAGRSGKLYAKLLKDEEARAPIPFWRADSEPVDTRLAPGKIDSSTFQIPAGTRSVHVRILYRRFWRDIAAVKHWPDEDIVVAEQVLDAPP
jgi:hypothetical protein